MFENKLKKELDKVKDELSKLKEKLSHHNIIYTSGDELYYDFKACITSGITKNKVDKISEIERKLDALIELLGVKEVSCETIEPKLVKGKKEVSLAVKK